MTGLPPVPAGVTADGVQALPARLLRRLDEAVERARAWPVTVARSVVRVEADTDVAVTLTVPVRDAADVSCSCLLAPACLHRAAVLSIAPPADDAPAPAVAPRESSVDSAGTGDGREVEVAEAVWRAARDMLMVGVTGAGAVAQAGLLRAAHDARAIGLPRLSSAALRVVRRVRSARAGEPEFRLASLVTDLRETLVVAQRLRTGDRGAGLRGTARRAYRDVGNLRLYGLCCETIATASGYAGAITYLVDADGRLWQLGAVTPGGADLAAGRPDALVTIGEARVTYRELGRGGLRLVHAQASADGRLGSGRATLAVAAPGCGWTDDPAANLWQRPLWERLAAYADALREPDALRPCGYDLLFLDGTIGGHREAGVILVVDGTPITIAAPTDVPQLPYVDNLRVLGDAVGAPLRLLGRVAGPGTVHGLAVAASWLAGAFGGHADLGVDRLRRGDATRVAAEAPVTVAPARLEVSPVHLLTRRLERCVEGGRSAVPGVAADPGRLRAAQLHTAALLAERLDAEAVAVRRDFFGRVESTGTDRVALAWLAAAVYADAVERAGASAGWPTSSV